MGGLVREIELAGLRLRVQCATDAVAQAVEQVLDRWPSARSAQEPQEILELGNAAELKLTLSAGRVVVHGPLADFAAVLRGGFGTALDRAGGALLHGAGIVLGTGAVLCIAPSEGGKTTLCGKLAGRTPILSDETIAVRLDGPHPTLSGTPFWSGPPLPTTAGLYPLRAVCFLRKGGERLEPLDRAQALGAILAEWHLPERPGAAGDVFTRAEGLLAAVPTFALYTGLETDPLPFLREAAGQTSAESPHASS